MNRDLVFFVAGLSFGIVAGYFTFRAVVPDPVSRPAAAAAPAAASSPIGLDPGPEVTSLDEARVSELSKSAASDPTDASSRLELGKIYLDAGRYEEASAWFAAAVELVPRDLEARTQLALSHLNAGNLEQTVSAYEQILEIDPNHPPGLLGLGRVKLYLQQDIDGGLDLWKKLVAVAPSSPEAQSVRDELEALTSAHPGG